MSKMKVYGIDLSPFVRTALMTLHVLEEEYEFVEVNTLKGEAKKPEYLKKNPMHNIPFFEDSNGFGMNESHAIILYLAEKYDKTGKLYPKDLEVKARIHQRLFFDCERIWRDFSRTLRPLAFGGATQLDATVLPSLSEALQWFDEFVAPTGWVAGTPHMTVADISAFAVISTVWQSKGKFVELDKYANIAKWMQAMEKQIPNYEKANGAGLKNFVDIVWSRVLAALK